MPIARSVSRPGRPGAGGTGPGGGAWWRGRPGVVGGDTGPVELYHQPGVRVTSETFSVAGHHFPINELSDLRTARGPQDRVTSRAVRVTGAAVAGVGIALSYLSGPYRLSPPTYLLLGLAVFVPMALAAIGRRLRPPAFELWGRYQGALTLLFSSDQEREFGQVRQALIQARAVSRPPHAGEDGAAGAIWEPDDR